MERALDPQLLALALGRHERLPTATELASLIADVELGLLLGSGEISDELLQVGWYLHGVASTREATDLYGTERQRAAFQVAAHLFDLQLNSSDLDRETQAEVAFAAEIAYWRSSFDPNATAIYRRHIQGRFDSLTLTDDLGLVAPALGAALLAVDASFLFPTTQGLLNQINDLASQAGLAQLANTPLEAIARVVQATRHLLVFLVYGREERLDTARQELIGAITSEESTTDRLSRWVAAHLLQFGENLGGSSVWTSLPPEVPPGVRRAFSFATPRVATLWPPQVGILGQDVPGNPVLAESRRTLLSMPTSAGKTLVAQIVIATHLSLGRGGVCYVAPTRSLCEEVKSGLDARLRNIAFTVQSDIGDYAELTEVLDEPADVEVLTPERLWFLLRTDADEVLNRFSLFVFDEAHTVADKTRGWTLESSLSYLHTRTMETHHRIMLISAAMGNRHHFVGWMDEENLLVASHHADWRGPRRMHCIWVTDPVWDEYLEENTRSETHPLRRRFPMKGRLVARVSRSGRTKVLTTTEAIGSLALMYSSTGKAKRDGANSTAGYKMLVPLINLLSHHGPVLVVESTRAQTIRMARAIAAETEEEPDVQIQSLQDLVSSRLGEDHPLTSVIAKRVAFHHGALPLDVRSSIEEGIKEGVIQVLVATTTLTEGVNLPVRSVVVASQGSWTADEGYQEYITGSKLMNAVGRAGRATLETEGIVVLARQEVRINDFDSLDPEPDVLQIESSLSLSGALANLALFEQLRRTSEDAAFELVDRTLPGFLPFIWFLCSELERLEQAVTVEEVMTFLTRTLAWQQLPEPSRQQWEAGAELGVRRFGQTPEGTRARWARAGTSLASASVIDEVASEISRTEFSQQELEDPVLLTTRVLSDQRLDRLMQINEAPRVAFYSARAGRRQEVPVSILEILEAWMRGEEVTSISSRFLQLVPDPEFRLEQLGDFISECLEVFLPWSLGLAVSWANENALDGELQNWTPLPGNLPAYIRWGVDKPEALRLMIEGLSSRRLAHAIAEAWRAEERELSVDEWIRSMGIDEWRQEFAATVPELRQLLLVARPRRSGVAAAALSGETAEIYLQTDDADSAIEPGTRVDVSVTQEGDEALPPLIVSSEHDNLGHVPSTHYQDLRDLIATGLSLEFEVVDEVDVRKLRIRLTEVGEE